MDNLISRALPPRPASPIQAALAPLPEMCGGDPRRVFDLALCLYPSERRQLAAVLSTMLPSLVSRAVSLSQAMGEGFMFIPFVLIVPDCI